MNYSEIKLALSLTIIILLRMLGIFMILPTLTTYGMNLNGANELLIGIAIGVYGLMQAIFQIPFGVISDKLGKKFTIIIGLIVFILGNIFSALTDNIYFMILGRAIQGSGAISAVIMSLLLDSINDEQNQVKIMAAIGIAFAITFIFSTTIGPVISRIIGINGLFWMIVILNLVSLLITLLFVPNKNNVNKSSKIVCSNISNIIVSPYFLKLNLSILFLSSLLILNFIAMPNIMNSCGILFDQQWKVYLVVTLLSFLIIILLNLKFIKNIKNKIKEFFIFCIVLLILSESLLILSRDNIYVILICIQIFFLSFNSIETVLPTIINKESPLGYKGVIMGIYLTSQFVGMALGGLFGGFLLHTIGTYMILIFEIFISFLWLFIILKLERYSSYIRVLNIKIPKIVTYNTEELIHKIKNQPGIIEFLIDTKKKNIYIKLDVRKISFNKVKDYLFN